MTAAFSFTVAGLFSCLCVCSALCSWVGFDTWNVTTNESILAPGGIGEISNMVYARMSELPAFIDTAMCPVLIGLTTPAPLLNTPPFGEIGPHGVGTCGGNGTWEGGGWHIVNLLFEDQNQL